MNIEEIMIDESTQKIIACINRELKSALMIHNELHIDLATVHRRLKTLSDFGLIIKYGREIGHKQHSSNTYISNIILYRMVYTANCGFTRRLELRNGHVKEW